MFVVCLPEESDKFHEDLLNFEVEIFEELGLKFRVLDMPTEDLGNPAYRKFDIEAWIPSRGGFGEISSTSNCTDYQSRRLDIRYQLSVGENFYTHTLNGTALAVPRIILSLLENNLQEDGSVAIPDCLVPFMGGLKQIK